MSVTRLVLCPLLPPPSQTSLSGPSMAPGTHTVHVHVHHRSLSLGILCNVRVIRESPCSISSQQITCNNTPHGSITVEEIGICMCVGVLLRIILQLWLRNVATTCAHAPGMLVHECH